MNGDSSHKINYVAKIEDILNLKVYEDQTFCSKSTTVFLNERIWLVKLREGSTIKGTTLFSSLLYYNVKRIEVFPYITAPLLDEGEDAVNMLSSMLSSVFCK